MGDSKKKAEREARELAAWADDLVADAAAIMDAAGRYAQSVIPGASDDAKAGLAAHLASLAAQRAVATDLLDAVAPQDEEPEDNEPPKEPFSLVTKPA